MIKRAICIFVFMIACFVFGQDFNKHMVEKGETITQIAQKYNVTPYDIYQLNPDVQGGLKPNSVLLIPIKGSAKKTVSNAITHKVEPKETLFGIEKKYGVSDEALKSANPDLEKLGLQIGQILVIPSSTVVKATVSTPEKAVFHNVLPKETKYSIAKAYGITIEELERKNPEIIPNLPIGYKLIIKGNRPKNDKITVVETKKDSVKSILTKTVIPQEIEIKKSLKSKP
jgi:LysM repeat protein